MAKFFRRGKSKIYFLPTVAGASPTRAEITAGTDLTQYIADIGGFSVTNAPINVPDLGSTFTKSIPGEDTTAASTLTMYDDDTSAPYRTALAKGTRGFIVLMPYGDVVSKRCEVWDVTSTGVNDEWNVGSDAARVVVNFSVNDVPKQNAVVPA